MKFGTNNSELDCCQIRPRAGTLYQQKLDNSPDSLSGQWLPQYWLKGSTWPSPHPLSAPAHVILTAPGYLPLLLAWGELCQGKCGFGESEKWERSEERESQVGRWRVAPPRSHALPFIRFYAGRRGRFRRAHTRGTCSGPCPPPPSRSPGRTGCGTGSNPTPGPQLGSPSSAPLAAAPRLVHPLSL